MPHINLLSPHVADLIAAGEVVERPASVIKELMENAFDAGAKNVTVEIHDGGATMIRITDDGCGMAPEDAGIAFLRHATSKLRDEHGLEAIATMGFRGEALAAISAVSRIELYTRRPEDAEGTHMTLTGGDIEEMEPTGCPAGTSICVRDLFFNTPARLKFLKSDRSEASACVQAGLRCALGRPEISVRFLRDGREEFFTPGDGDQSSVCYALLGREAASTMLPVQSADEGIRLTGFISSPSAGRGNRGMQYFYVNGRFIRSSLLQSALEQAYKNTLLTGRYPGCVIYLDIRPGAVDVNVHPAKIEVKFSEERKVFHLLFQAAQDTLRGEDRAGAPEKSSETRTEPEPEPLHATPAAKAPVRETVSPLRTEPQTERPRPDLQELSRPGEHRPAVYETGDLPPLRKAAEPVWTAEPAAPWSSLFTETPAEPEKPEKPEETAEELPAEPKPASAAAEEAASDDGIVDFPNYRIVGEALKTYLIVETGDRLILIDKHAAHERMNFDRLKQSQQPVPAQQLLVPQTLRVSGEELGLLEEFGDLFRDFGFEIEPFGQNAVILRAVPADMLPDDAAPALEEILEHLREGGTPDPRSARDEVLHTVACKAAIKAGWDTGTEELERIAEEVLSGRVKYCPHGRPVSATVTRKDLDKLFLRIV